MGQTLEEVKEQAKELDRKRKGWFLAAMQKFVTLKPSGTLPCLRKDTALPAEGYPGLWDRL